MRKMQSADFKRSRVRKERTLAVLVNIRISKLTWGLGKGLLNTYAIYAAG